MPITVTPVSDALGAEIGGIDLRRPLDGETVGRIHRAFLDHLVLVVRGQELEQDDLVRFTGYFGDVGAPARPKEYRTVGQRRVHEKIMLITNVRENGEPIGTLPDGEMSFHHDMMHADVPHKATLLYAVDIPSHGGNTLFANLYKAYETLPDEVRRPLEGRRAFHHYNYGSQHKGDDKGVPAFSEAVHPVFRTHAETGRKAIYVNRLMTEGVVDMDRRESDALLTGVYDHSERSEFVYEHVWRPGDLIMWDNGCTMHARRDFPADQRRLMWRTTIDGVERPV